jgi:hypothetical protein
MKFNSLVIIFLCFIFFVLFSCKDIPNQPIENTDTSKIIFGKSIEGVFIGDDSLTVIQKLGQPTAIQDGDFNGYIFHYTEGKPKLANIYVFVSKDPNLGLGVIVITIESPYQGKSKDSIGIGSERNFVISKIGLPDTTQGEFPSIDDIYNYERNSFGINYANYLIHRISMGKPRLY